jgi:hypothetical protein
MITFLTKNWKEQQLAKRISDILVGDKSSIPRKENGNWSLDSNWFLKVLDDGSAKLTYRYEKSPEQWAALRVVIEMVL